MPGAATQAAGQAMIGPTNPGGRPRVNLLGTSHGGLRVLTEAPAQADGRTRWRCECTHCGSICTVRTDHLLDDSRPRTCGCIAPSRRRYSNWWAAA